MAIVGGLALLPTLAGVIGLLSLTFETFNRDTLPEKLMMIFLNVVVIVLFILSVILFLTGLTDYCTNKYKYIIRIGNNQTMTKYLPLETSKKLVELIGFFDTEVKQPNPGARDIEYPAPDFGEIVLLLPSILQAKGSLAFGGTTDSEQYIAHRICFSYIDSGGNMEAVAKVLEEIIG